MKLNVKERLLINQFLPEKGGITTMILMKGIKEKVQISSDEANKIGLTDTGNGRIVWDVKKAKDKDVQFNESEIKLLKKGVETLDKAERITEESLELALKIKETA